MLNERMSLWVTTQFVGFHKWSIAPDDVAYLRDRHRHVFGVRVSVDVRADDDRVIEFHMLQTRVNTWVREYLQEGDQINGEKADVGSCEQVCKYLMYRLHKSYGENINAAIEVNEDQECGALFSTSDVF